MDISGYKPLFEQTLLWDRDLNGHGGRRTFVGDLCERLTVQLVNGRRHKTDSTKAYCPDVSARCVYFESKGVGRSRTAFIYGGRLDKDREFAKRHKLVYVIWHHTADTKSVETHLALWQLVVAKMKCVYIVPFFAVDRICSTLQPDKLNSAYGGSNTRTEYGSGYRIHLRLLERWIHRKYEDGYARESK